MLPFSRVPKNTSEPTLNIFGLSLAVVPGTLAKKCPPARQLVENRLFWLGDLPLAEGHRVYDALSCFELEFLLEDFALVS